MKLKMNRIFFQIVPLIAILFCIPYYVFTDDQVGKVFRRLKEYAHPTPVEFPKELPSIPLSNESGLPFFYNIPITVEETGTFQMQNESSIAVNPAHPNILIASAVDYRDTSATWVYYSTDAGRVWKNKKLGRPYPDWRSSNDPSVAFSYDGIGYLVYGGFGILSDTGVLAGENGVFLARSTDGGINWEPHIPIIVHRGAQTLDSAFEDKYYITCDNSPNSPYRGHLYVPWKRVIPRDSSTQIVISKSTNRGSNWTQPLPVSPRKSGTSEDTTFGQSFPLCTIGPNGEVYLVWNDGTESSIGFAKSLDGGTSFSLPRNIVKYKPFGKTKYISGQGYRHTVKGLVRAEAYPSIVCDVTGGARNGYLYLCWSSDSIPNVYFSRSTDGGETWSNPIIVHSDTNNDQFWQWIAIDPTNGDLAIMYLDSRNDPKNIMAECYTSYSSDGGESWLDRRVSDVSMDLRLNPFTENSFAGDYSGCAFFAGRIYPSWVDMRNAVKNIYDSDVYTAYINVNSPNSPGNFIAQILPSEPEALLLRWTQPSTKIFGHPLDTSKVKYILKREGNFLALLPYNQTTYKDTGLTRYNLYKYSIVAISEQDTSIELTAQAFAGGSKNPAVPTLLSAESIEPKTIRTQVQIPSLREDSSTALVNLRSILFFDGNTPLGEFSLQPQDTGQIVSIEVAVPEVGFYQLRAKIKDIDGNTSRFSDEVTVYTGEIINPAEQVYLEKFDIENRKKFLRKNGWDYTTNFFYSANSSITDSPQGNYPNRTTLEFTIFPFALSGNKRFTLSFENSAIIHRTDTGYVELVDKNGNFVVLAGYNMEMFEPWKDKMLDQSDWRRETLTLDPIEISKTLDISQLYLRFKLVSGTLGTDDGWYLDDVMITTETSSVEINRSKRLDVYPSPASNYLYLELLDDSFKEIYLVDLFGNRFSILERLSKISEALFMFPLNDIPTGVYQLLCIDKKGNYFTKSIIVSR